MPVNILDNNLFKVRNLRVESDKNGAFLTMNPGKSAACVICVSKQEPVNPGDLELSEMQLKDLYTGRTLDFSAKGYTLKGVTRQQFAAAPQFRDFKMTPPTFVQVWGMGINDRGAITLYTPEDPQEQCVLVAVGYRKEMRGSDMYVWIEQLDGYEDGDLLYQVDGRLPVPIPASGLNRPLPMRPGVDPVVMPRPECADKYTLK